MSELEDVNKEISQDNDRTQLVLEKTERALDQNLENVAKIQTYLLESVKAVQNTTAVKAMLQVSNNVNAVILKLRKTKEDMIKASQNPKIYTPLIEEETEEEPENDESKSNSEDKGSTPDASTGSSQAE